MYKCTETNDATPSSFFDSFRLILPKLALPLQKEQLRLLAPQGWGITAIYSRLHQVDRIRSVQLVGATDRKRDRRCASASSILQSIWDMQPAELSCQSWSFSPFL